MRLSAGGVPEIGAGRAGMLGSTGREQMRSIRKGYQLDWGDRFD